MFSSLSRRKSDPSGAYNKFLLGAVVFLIVLVVGRIAWNQTPAVKRSRMTFPEVAATLERRQEPQKQIKQLAEPTSEIWRQARPLLSTLPFDADVHCPSLTQWERVRVIPLPLTHVLRIDANGVGGLVA